MEVEREGKVKGGGIATCSENISHASLVQCHIKFLYRTNNMQLIKRTFRVSIDDDNAGAVFVWIYYVAKWMANHLFLIQKYSVESFLFIRQYTFIGRQSYFHVLHTIEIVPKLIYYLSACRDSSITYYQIIDVTVCNLSIT